MPLDTGSRLGHYEIGALIGEGGMGQVYRATDTKLNRQVALKVLPDVFASDPSRLARFRREAQVLAHVNHPGIAAIYGIEDTEGAPALILELVEGTTLAERIARGPVPLDEALRLARQIAEALDAAHEEGVIHRDLKPANIKLTNDGATKVLDFGLAKASTPEAGDGDSTDAPTMTAMATAVGTILGTPAYMAPEQARGEQLDKRADIWAYGCVLFEMLTGRRAFDGETPAELVAAVLEREPDWEALPAATPPLARRLVRRCLEKDPKRRLRDIADALADLEDAADAATAATPTGASTRLRFWRVALLAATALGLFGLGIAGLGVLRPPSSPAPRHFVLLPPEGAEFSGSIRARTASFALSPDGDRLAFVAGSGSSSVWIQSLDSLEALRLSGTEGASTFSPPAWSPDGDSIAFFAAGQLKTVSASGGTPLALADAASGYGVTWNRDDTLVFAPDPQSGLFRISARGGTPTPVTQLAPGDYGHLFPQFLPDGRHFLYLVRAASPRKGVYVGATDSPLEKFVRSAREKALYAPPGHLLFLQEGALMAQPFDVGTFEVSGEPLPVSASVAYVSNGRASFDVSPTGTLAYRVSGMHAGSRPILVDRTGATVATSGRPRGLSVCRSLARRFAARRRATRPRDRHGGPVDRAPGAQVDA